MPILMGNNGETYTITRISGKQDVHNFLESLGFVPGSEVTIVSSMGSGLILEVKDSRIAVDKDMAKHIIV